MQALEACGLKGRLEVDNGGNDASWLNAHGIPTVNMGAGAYDVHTVNEYVDLKVYLDACRVAVAILAGV